MTVRLKSDRIIHHVDGSDFVFVEKILNLLDGPYGPDRSILPGEVVRPIELLLRINYNDEFRSLCWIDTAKV